MVSRGDIFRLGYEADSEATDLYVMETTSQTGDIYARRFDPERGGYGELVLLPQTREFQVLGHVQRQKPRSGWCYCTVYHRVEWKDQWTGTESFVAEADDSRQVIAHSPSRPVIRGEATLLHASDQSRSIHRALIDHLVAQGWQPVINRRPHWFQASFQRPLI